MYEIRFCKISEEEKLLNFLKENWKEDHIFIKNKELFRWQHLDRINNRINFVVAENKNDGEFDAILGFIPFKQYDKNLKNNDLWYAIWKIKKEKTLGKIRGIDLLFFVEDKLNLNSSAGIGMSKYSVKSFTQNGFTMGKLSHYYLLNESLCEYKIAKIPLNSSLSHTPYRNTNTTIRELYNISELESIKELYKPYKSPAFIKNKYLNHPVYSYKLYGIYCFNKLLSVLVTRKISILDRSCIRIIDIYGRLNKVGNISAQLQEILKKENAEYIDCYNYGIDEQIFTTLGFLKKEHDNNIIIPNYFEPFEQKNIEIICGHKGNYDEYVFFKGDSDQDRPNI
ncbi:hypothetical protein CLTEP_04060 [Clostridium tepidiprofundi DSM 19306]|uniref:Uncharacterized protein n=1 Tax=Clostridium tepidiprofundi DSM 19306 TaxID=1121338 RepID=A0A151B8F4_9CLOT|nr:hypothetical protein [Clostridium tepidiprofundi]KYH36012.1 hypothetical protein CLTEP_04060 [Clostridium tepidiprofundi DSM 19306]